jgi:hypothetical protein
MARDGDARDADQAQDQGLHGLGVSPGTAACGGRLLCVNACDSDWQEHAASTRAHGLFVVELLR